VGFTSRDFDANGEGEVVGGIVVMRYGENADKVIDAVKNERSRKVA
jgi:Cu(I)/Ag(I) efflux system membrane protein CusA/SilA